MEGPLDSSTGENMKDPEYIGSVHGTESVGIWQDVRDGKEVFMIECEGKFITISLPEWKSVISIMEMNAKEGPCVICGATEDLRKVPFSGDMYCNEVTPCLQRNLDLNNEAY